MGAYPVYPRSAFLQWCEAHRSVFTDHAAYIGLSPEEAAAFVAATDKTRTAQLRYDEVRAESKSVTVQTTDAYDDLRKTLSNTVRNIRAFAETSDDPNAVYTVAEIPPPAQPSPLPPPGQPERLTVLLDPAAGTMTLRWKCENPTGASSTAYVIRRRLPGETAFAVIGISGKKEFVDDTFVAGPDTVQYTVQGQRGDSTGPLSPIFTVNFGLLPSGNRTATVSTAGNVPAMLNVDIPAPVGNGRSFAKSR